MCLEAGGRSAGWWWGHRSWGTPAVCTPGGEGEGGGEGRGGGGGGVGSQLWMECYWPDLLSPCLAAAVVDGFGACLALAVLGVNIFILEGRG